ncbi:MAG TPA: HAD-IA family hydrolase [Ktedonobacteraceae bacterium]|nr:HAD-IA family hydrolase [Ktedonobacteraceae bacterium]
MNIKGFLFDLDGTLANTLPLCIKTYQYTLQHFTGRSYAAEEITTHFGFSEEGIFQRMLPQQWEAAMQYYIETYQKLHDECREPFADIETALQLLEERGIHMAVVTGKSALTAALTLEYLNIAQYFDVVEAGRPDAVVKEKAIRKILANWQMEPGDAAYIGDTVTDIEEATGAGVLLLGAGWAETSTLHRLTSMKPFATFASVEDFIGWLDKNITPVNV